MELVVARLSLPICPSPWSASTVLATYRKSTLLWRNRQSVVSGLVYLKRTRVEVALLLSRDFLINPSDILTQLYSSGQKTAGFSHPEIKGGNQLIQLKCARWMRNDWNPFYLKFVKPRKLPPNRKSVAWWLASHKTTRMVPVGKTLYSVVGANSPPLPMIPRLVVSGQNHGDAYLLL